MGLNCFRRKLRLSLVLGNTLVLYHRHIRWTTKVKIIPPIFEIYAPDTALKRVTGYKGSNETICSER